MRNYTLHQIILACASLLATAVSIPSQATPVMELKPELLLTQAASLKKDLTLNANQQLLWQQTESKLQAITHQRQLRRERMQAELELRLEQNNVELRDLNPQIEQEEQTSLQENKQMRELFLTLNDALDDKQRQSLQLFFNTALRNTADGARSKPAEAGNDGNKRKGGMGGRQRGGEGKF